VSKGWARMAVAIEAVSMAMVVFMMKVVELES
jgi:hypothetical protein